MLVVRQVETANPGLLGYECLDRGQVVGRLQACFNPATGLEIELGENSNRQAPRSLVAKIERDAAENGIFTFLLKCRDEREVESFLPAGYLPREPGSLLLVKKIRN